MKPSELTAILESHGRWRRGECGSRANLTGAYLARAYLADANLADANLTGADLARADLTGADLTGADLTDAYLARAYLTGADLTRANLADANLTGADLARANLTGADLTGANLTGADLTGADLTGARNVPTGIERTDPPAPFVRGGGDRAAYARRYRERHPEVPVVENLDAAMLAAIERPGCSLNMGAWHTCETTHCRAGWAITLAGEAGKALEAEVGPRWAGAMIYRASTGRAPHFFATESVAMEDIRRCAAEAKP